MTAAEAYPALRHAHLGLVTLSVAVFAVRGLGTLAGAAWPAHRAARVGTALVDTLLLASGGALWWQLNIDALQQPWLAVKLALLPVYVVLGVFALRRARTRAARALCLLAALATAALMVGIARAHDPRGWWAVGGTAGALA